MFTALTAMCEAISSAAVEGRTPAQSQIELTTVKAVGTIVDKI